jgi:hypothetical protein
VHVLGIETLREPRRIDDIDEEDRDLFALTLQSTLGSENSVGEVFRGVCLGTCRRRTSGCGLTALKAKASSGR